MLVTHQNLLNDYVSIMVVLNKKKKKKKFQIAILKPKIALQWKQKALEQPTEEKKTTYTNRT